MEIIPKKIFIASSNKSRKHVEEIIRLINNSGQREYVELYPWWDCFPIGTIVIEQLINLIPKFDAGIFILASDDCVYEENSFSKKYLPRDNVLMEAGMFLSSKGLKNICICEFENVHIPTDFSGVTVLKYTDCNRESDLFTWIENITFDTYKPNNILPTYICEKSTLENQLSLERRLNGAKEIRLLNYAGTSFWGSNNVANSYPSIWKEWIHNALSNGLQAEFIITDLNSSAAEDAAKYKMFPRNNTKIHKNNIISQNRMSIVEYKEKNPQALLDVWETEIALPYALFETIFDDDSKNHIKVDLYSPLTYDDGKRPSFMVYKNENLSLYMHFSSIIDNIINNDMATKKIV